MGSNYYKVVLKGHSDTIYASSQENAVTLASAYAIINDLDNTLVSVNCLGQDKEEKKESKLSKAIGDVFEAIEFISELLE